MSSLELPVREALPLNVVGNAFSTEEDNANEGEDWSAIEIAIEAVNLDLRDRNPRTS